MAIDFKYVAAQTTDALIAATLRYEVICATSTKALKAPVFATFTQIEALENFFLNFAPEARGDYADDTAELERPLQATWNVQEGSFQRAVRAELAKLPAHIEGSETEFSAFIPMGPIANFKGDRVYIPGYHIVVAQEGLEACLWTHTLRARGNDVVHDKQP